MEFGDFVRRPFLVEAVQINSSNIHDIAAFVKGDVKKIKGKLYIALDRRVIPNVTRAFEGWWVTRFNESIRCFSDKVFREQFLEYTEALAPFFDDEDEELPEDVPAPLVISAMDQ